MGACRLTTGKPTASGQGGERCRYRNASSKPMKLPKAKTLRLGDGEGYQAGSVRYNGPHWAATPIALGCS